MAFGFSLLFLYSISRWAYKKYDEVSKQSPQADPAKINSTKWIYITSFAAGICLVAVSVAWWFGHRPIYVVKGTIRGLDHNTRVSSPELYFLDRPHPAAGNNDLPAHDGDFVAVSEHSFKKGHPFPIDYSKNEVTHDQLGIEYDPDNTENVFTPKFEDGKNTLIRVSSLRPSTHRNYPEGWLQPQTVYAQERVPAQQPTFKIARPPASRNEPPQPRASSSTGMGHQTWALDQNLIEVLKDPHSPVGTKILALEKLNATDPATRLAYMETSVDGTPFAATIEDLTRHSDPELAYDASSVVESVDLKSHLRNGLSAEDVKTRKNAQVVLGHFDQSEAIQLAQGVKGSQNHKLLAVKNPALVPTNFPDGDRYYMQIGWNSSDQKQADCLTNFFSNSLDVAGSPEQEASALKGRNHRLIYSVYKDWVVSAAAKIEGCRATVSFVRPSSEGSTSNK